MKFSTLDSKYSLTFERYSKIEPSEDDGSIMKYPFNFQTIAQLNDTRTSSRVDVAAIIGNVGATEIVKLRKSNIGGPDGHSEQRLYLTIFDDSYTCIEASIIGD